MKQKIISLILTAALVLNTGVLSAFAAGDAAGTSTGTENVSDSGTATGGLCDHHTAHDDTCGGVTGTATSSALDSCNYVCNICTVQAMIDALPTVEQYEDMSHAEQAEVHDQVAQTQDAYRAVYIDDRKQITATALNDLLAAIMNSVWVGGVKVTETNADDVLGDADGDGATVKYDADANTLTLEGASITGNPEALIKYGIYSSEALTIKLVGANEVKTVSNGSVVISVNTDLTLINGETDGGNGSLDIQYTGEGSTDGMSVGGLLSMTDVIVTCNNRVSSRGGATISGGSLILTAFAIRGGDFSICGGAKVATGSIIAYEALTISGDTTEVKADGANTAISAYGALTIEDGAKVTAVGRKNEKYPENTYRGISVNGGDIKITGAATQVTATSFSSGMSTDSGIYVSGGNIEITDAQVTATGTEGGIYVNGNNIAGKGTVTIDGARVNATANGSDAAIYGSNGVSITGTAHVRAQRENSGTSGVIAGGETGVALGAGIYRSASGDGFTVHASGEGAVTTGLDGTYYEFLGEKHYDFVAVDENSHSLTCPCVDESGAAVVSILSAHTGMEDDICDDCGFQYYRYSVWVGGIQVTIANAGDVLGDTDDVLDDNGGLTEKKTVTYVPASDGTPAILTLTDVNIRGNVLTGVGDGTNSYGIYAEEPLAIRLSGENEVNMGYNVAYGIYSTGSLDFSGDGTLKVYGTENGLYSEDDISVTSGEVVVNGQGIDSGKGVTVGKDGMLQVWCGSGGSCLTAATVDVSGMLWSSNIELTDEQGAVTVHSTGHLRLQVLDTVTQSGVQPVSGTVAAGEGTTLIYRSGPDSTPFEPFQGEIAATGFAEILGNGHYTVTPDPDNSEQHAIACKTELGCYIDLDGSAEANVGWEEHTGGTATCKDKAVCEICGQSYGDLASTSHTDGTEVRDAAEATTTTEGYTGDTYCLGCGTKLETGTVIPVLTPTPETTVTPTPGETPTPEPTPETTVTPTPGETPTPEPTPETTVTPTPGETPTPEPTPGTTVTPTPGTTVTPTPGTTVTPTPDITVTPTPGTTVTPTPGTTVTPTPETTVTPTPGTTVTPTPEPTEVPAVPTETPAPTPVPGIVEIPSSGEEIVDSSGEPVHAIVQKPGTTNQLELPGITEEESRTVTWESTNTNSVEVDEDGNVTMKEPGMAEIIVTIGEGESARTETIVIVVEEAPETVNDPSEAEKEVKLGPGSKDTASVRTVTVGEVLDINYYGVKNWQSGSYETVWTVADESVASVGSTGVITARKPGVTTLRLSLKNNATGELLYVKPMLLVAPADTENKIMLGTSADCTFEELALGLNERVDLNFYGVKDWKKEDYEYTWISSEPTVVWVDKVGKLTPVSPGTATVALVLVQKETGIPLCVVPVEVTVTK